MSLSGTIPATRALVGVKNWSINPIYLYSNKQLIELQTPLQRTAKPLQDRKVCRFNTLNVCSRLQSVCSPLAVG